MKQYSLAEILRQIGNRFTDSYNFASNFVGTPIYESCLEIIRDADALRKIVSENDNGIPPVETLLDIMADRKSNEVIVFTDQDAQQTGMLMAFLFKNVFGYMNQKEDIFITNKFGIRTAALYCDREPFEITEETY